MEKINLQVKLTGTYAETFNRFKKNHPMDGRDNIVAMMAMLRTLPEWKEVNSECQKAVQ